jgi:hypothetical protein
MPQGWKTICVVGRQKEKGRHTDIKEWVVKMAVSLVVPEYEPKP